mmetsp:Transcript_22008/g.52068  ORF Transcript_22008/g.52068 Transcript_22008/m.52068 type:complete len:489 (+) Transcript_22008:265-1731(+)
MSDTDADDAAGETNLLAVDHATREQVDRLIKATQGIQAAHKGKSSKGEMNRAINELNQAWREMTSAPRGTFTGLWQPVNWRPPAEKRNPMDNHTNVPLESASKRGTAAEGEKEVESEEEEEDGSRMEEDEESHDARQKVRAARAYLLELRSDNKYDSDYAIAQLPSIIGMTDANIDYVFLEAEYSDLVVANILLIIKGMLAVHRLGMNKAKLFRPTTASSEKTWEPIVGGTVGSLASNLDESTSQEAEKSAEYDSIRYAMLHAAKSGDFPLPSNTGINVLAKHFLTVNETTRTHLLVLVFLAAGCSAFTLLDPSDLVDRDNAIISSSNLATLGYDENQVPTCMNEVLMSFKDSFNDKDINSTKKIALQATFDSITKKLANLPADDWKSIDETEFNESSSSSSSSSSSPSSGSPPYFAASNDAGEARRTKAIHILSVVVMSKFIYERTRGSVEYGDYEDFSEVVFRNSVNSCYLKSSPRPTVARPAMGT